MRFDWHVHVAPGALSTTGECVQRASKMGLEGFAAVTRGGIMSELFFLDRAQAARVSGVVVTNAAEVGTDYGPLVIHGMLPINDVSFREQEPVDVVGLIDWVHDNGGAVVLPHLFRSDRAFFNQERILKGSWDWWIRKCDALEITWSGERYHDRLIQSIADRLSKRVVYGTDAHYHGQVGVQVVDCGLGLLADWREQHLELVRWIRSRP